MAVTIARYNHTAAKLLGGDVDLDNLKLMLLNDSASFTASNTTLAQVSNSGSYEVHGSGWTQGGEDLASVSVSTVDTDGAMLDAADISVTATGGAIGPAYKAVIYDDSDASDAPLWFIDFDGAQTAGEGTDFKITINASGIFRVTDPA